MKEEDQSAGSSGTPLEWGLTQSTPALNSPLYVSSVALVSSEATILCNMGSFEFGESISTLNLRAIIYYYCVPSTSSNGSVFFFFFSSSGLGPFLSVCRMHEQLPQGEKPVMMLGAQLHVAKFQLQMSLVASHSQCFSAHKDVFFISRLKPDMGSPSIHDPGETAIITGFLNPRFTFTMLFKKLKIKAVASSSFCRHAY